MKEESFWVNRKVMVTGATGFIGMWLVNELVCKGANVFALVRNSSDEIHLNKSQCKGILELIIGSVEDLNILETAIRSKKIEIIFHLAANNTNIGTTLLPLSILETNIRGGYNLFEAARLQSKQMPTVILASSQEAEKFHDAISKIRKKRHPYEVSKTCVELISNAYTDTYGLNIAIIRSENVYGGRDLNWNRLIPSTIRFICNGERPVIRSSGEIKRDYIYIEDIINAFLRVGEITSKKTDQNKVFHLGTEVNTTTFDIVKKICKLMNVNHNEVKMRNGNYHERKHTFQSTEETVAWYNTFFHCN